MKRKSPRQRDTGKSSAKSRRSKYGKLTLVAQVTPPSATVAGPPQLAPPQPAATPASVVQQDDTLITEISASDEAFLAYIEAQCSGGLSNMDPVLSSTTEHEVLSSPMMDAHIMAIRETDDFGFRPHRVRIEPTPQGADEEKADKPDDASVVSATQPLTATQRLDMTPAASPEILAATVPDNAS